MKYIGLQQQISSNNRKSILLLMGFPILVLIMVFLFFFIVNYSEEGPPNLNFVFDQFIITIPYILGGVAVWFLIAYFFNTAMINRAAKSHTLSRKDHMRVYNLTENLCISVGMPMPKLRIIESQALNAFASGINQKNFTVTLTRGIIDQLNDEELEGVIAHELMHIRNNDVKLLIVSIVFVGIFSFILQFAFRSFLYGGMSSRRNNKNDGKGGAAVMVVIMVLAALAYFLSLLFKFALSRKREYLADSGAAEMTKNPLGLASALEKISGNHHVDAVKNEDVQQMFIENAPEDTSASLFGGFKGMFSTHPPIEKRIQILKQF
ncbi:M48 family metallopeptidase [Brumimicrobium aurantiacum]|uniref:Protease HtpX homolog n=1 Tax=Brumimicrobium aurantiacum TaxID=1737063 RepID=A0A3E1F0E6_9FLAO|nr:M48 family metallopeptidase [Brumimicrobium aurantiacum]RFC55275.1 protease [Brumimicrobium aurantiacum]